MHTGSMQSAQRVDRSATIKASIRAAAAHLFAEHGFAATGVRDIADRAGVDKSIVIRHFGSKEALFVETISLPSEWTVAMEGPLEHLPKRLVALMAGGAESAGQGVFKALIRATDSDDVRDRLYRGLTETIAVPIAARLEQPDAFVRAHLFAAAVVGVLTSLWVIEDEVLTRLTPEVIADAYSPALRQLLTSS